MAFSSPPKRPSLCQTRRELNKDDFYFHQIYILQKNWDELNLNQSNFLICYDYIKNNSYINLGDGGHIRIV